MKKINSLFNRSEVKKECYLFVMIINRRLVGTFLAKLKAVSNIENSLENIDNSLFTHIFFSNNKLFFILLTNH